MPHQAKDEHGFTLIELLIVMSILLILLSIPIIKFSSYHQTKLIDQFFIELENDVLFAQQYAISHSDTVKVYFYNSTSSYKIFSGNNNMTLLTRNYDSAITIEPLTLGTNVTFRSNGNVSKSGTMRVLFKKDKYNVVFQLGKGRFYVSKL